jgi:hypothetical protein
MYLLAWWPAAARPIISTNLSVSEISVEFGRSVQSNHDYCQSSPDMSQSVVGKFRSFYTTIDQVRNIPAAL